LLRFRRDCLRRPGGLSSPGNRLSWGSCSLERNDAGCPFFAPPRSCDHSGEGGGRQTPTGAVLRVLAPLDGSGHARGTHETLADPAVHRGAPTLRGLVPCRSRPWSRPTELSPLEEPYPLSRASCFRAGSRSTAPRRGTFQGFRGSFRRRADLSPRHARRHAGLEGRDDGSPESLGVARHALPRSFTASRPGSAGLAAFSSRHARFEALLPSRVRSRIGLRPGQGTAARSVLSWACPL